MFVALTTYMATFQLSHTKGNIGDGNRLLFRYAMTHVQFPYADECVKQKQRVQYTPIVDLYVHALYMSWEAVLDGSLTAKSIYSE